MTVLRKKIYVICLKNMQMYDTRKFYAKKMCNLFEKHMIHYGGYFSARERGSGPGQVTKTRCHWVDSQTCSGPAMVSYRSWRQADSRLRYATSKPRSFCDAIIIWFLNACSSADASVGRVVDYWPLWGGRGDGAILGAVKGGGNPRRRVGTIRAVEQLQQ